MTLPVYSDSVLTRLYVCWSRANDAPTWAVCPTIQLNSTLPTWRQHQIPQVQGLAPWAYPHYRHFKCQSQVQGVTCASDPWLQIGDSNHLLLGFINLLEQLTELRETFYLLDDRFITKDIIQEQLDGREAYSKVWGKGRDLPCALSTPLSLRLPVFSHLGSKTPSPVLWGLYRVSWGRHNWLNDWPPIQPLAPLLFLDGYGIESSNPSITRLVPLATSPQPQVLSTSHLISITKDTLLALHSGNSLGAWCQEQGRILQIHLWKAESQSCATVMDRLWQIISPPKDSIFFKWEINLPSLICGIGGGELCRQSEK